MKKGDFIWSLGLIAISVFLFAPTTGKFYLAIVSLYPYLTGYVKFAILATMGELLAVRITKGEWLKPSGLFYKALVWGMFGMIITFMFRLFPAGVASSIKMGSGFWGMVVSAFLSSAIMNLTFAPVFMATHRVTDTFIEMKVEKKSIKLPEIIEIIDWPGFIKTVVCKTIPFFWIPVHTICFLLPSSYRVLAAAYLSIVLGAILAYAKNKKTKMVSE